MRELIAQIQLIEAEQQRRASTKLAKYNSEKKVHKKQLTFHKCHKRNRWVFGGNRSGKTECGAVEAVWMARGIHPYRKNRKDVEGWVVSPSYRVQRDVAQQKVLSYLDTAWIADIVMAGGKASDAANGYIDSIIVHNVFGGKSRIGFRSCEAGREKFQGASLDFVWFDEEPPKDIYDECKMRLLDKKGDMFGTMTPLKGLTFLYEEIVLNCNDSAEVWCQFMEWADNPFLDKKEVARLTSEMSEEMLLCRRYGQFSSSAGLVYPEFDANIHVIKPFAVPTEWYDKLSIDPGLNNPLSCHWYAVDYDGSVYVIAEHYQKGKDVFWHSERIKEICKRLDWHTDSFGRYTALIDSAANQRTLAAVKSVSELFFENGIAVNPKVNKDIFYGVNRVKSYLMPLDRKPKLFIFDTCVNMIKEIKSYWWGEEERPKKSDDHAMDELRYYLCSRPETKMQLPQKTEIQKDKEKLLRKIARQL